MGNRRGPSPIEEILPEVRGRTDTGYALRVHMHGLHGIWHRLWASLVLAEKLRDPDTADVVHVVRDQFEQQLGRSMTQDEWELLEADARSHAASVPNLD